MIASLPLLWIATLSRDAWFGSRIAGLVMVAYEPAMHARWGQTLGKMALKIQVRTVRGHSIGMHHALRRSAVDIVLSIIYLAMLVLAWSAADFPFRQGMGVRQTMELGGVLPGFLIYRRVSDVWFWSEIVTMLFNKRRRALHDLLGGTVVARVPNAGD